jgi:hypothetical protein
MQAANSALVGDVIVEKPEAEERRPQPDCDGAPWYLVPPGERPKGSIESRFRLLPAQTEDPERIETLLDLRALYHLAARNFRSVSERRLWFRNDLGESADKLNAILT